MRNQEELLQLRFRALHFLSFCKLQTAELRGEAYPGETAQAAMLCLPRSRSAEKAKSHSLLGAESLEAAFRTEKFTKKESPVPTDWRYVCTYPLLNQT